MDKIITILEAVLLFLEQFLNSGLPDDTINYCGDVINLTLPLIEEYLNFILAYFGGAV